MNVSFASSPEDIDLLLLYVLVFFLKESERFLLLLHLTISSCRTRLILSGSTEEFGSKLIAEEQKESKGLVRSPNPCFLKLHDSTGLDWGV